MDMHLCKVLKVINDSQQKHEGNRYREGGLVLISIHVVDFIPSFSPH